MVTATQDQTPASKSDLGEVGNALREHFDSRMEGVNGRLDEVNKRLSGLETGQQDLKSDVGELKAGQQEILRRLEQLNAT